MPTDTAIYDLSKPRHRSALISRVQGLDGKYRVTLKKVFRGRSVNQNAFYWAAVIPCLASAITESWGETISNGETHIFLKDKFLSQPVINRKTGEVMGFKQDSTTKLNVSQFCEYLDKIIKFAGEFLNVEVPEANADYWR